MEVAVGAGVLLMLGILALSITGLVFWVVKLVEVIKLPDHQYRAARHEKLTWVLVVALAGWIGGLIWHFAARQDVLAAEGVFPMPPPGWYPDQATGGISWWDGTRWSDAYHSPGGGYR